MSNCRNISPVPGSFPGAHNFVDCLKFNSVVLLVNYSCVVGAVNLASILLNPDNGFIDSASNHSTVNNVIKSFVVHSSDEHMRYTANFLFELIMIKNNRLRIGQSDEAFSYDKLQSMIYYVCTS